jgi:hypothetical protein
MRLPIRFLETAHMSQYISAIINIVCGRIDTNSFREDCLSDLQYAENVNESCLRSL